MTRVLKFRAWDKQAKLMLEHESFGGSLPLDDPNLVLMQFTGLHDRHGTEIYEADIVYHHYYGEAGILSWSNSKNQWVLKFLKDKVEQPDMFPIDHQSYEVLGNTYQHPQYLLVVDWEVVSDSHGNLRPQRRAG